MREGECRHPRPSEAAAEKNRENCVICSPPTVAISGGLRSACRWDRQFPTRVPVDLTLFTRLMPWANSGASSPLSAAPAATLRIADILIMMEDDQSRLSSSDTRHAFTVALVGKSSI